MCDLAEAALVERYEGDARAERTYSGRTVDEARDALYAALTARPEKDSTDPFTARLNRALGVS